ncbi:MAG: hypothetical protein H7328_07660 [Bdellovibrio sp.]|nr:hypothetical protein [Bdellovibrio sp.]
MKLLLLSILIFAGFDSYAAAKFERKPNSADIEGSANLLVQGNKDSVIRISGEAAAYLYKTMTVKETNSLDGAGPETFFKTGSLYRCFADVKNAAKGTSDYTNVLSYNCDIFLKDMQKGR